MTDLPLVSVITPTWQRHKKLLERCMPSVQAQTYRNVEHVIVSDGPDSVLDALLWGVAARQDVMAQPLMWDFLAERSPLPHWGTYARLRGIEISSGEYITYNDDDDALRPEHCEYLAKALDENPDAGFAYTRMISHQPSGDVVIGACDPPVYGQLGAPMIMHRRSLLELASWGEPDAAEDWKLVQNWLGAGVKYVSVNADTIDVWPSAYAGLE